MYKYINIYILLIILFLGQSCNKIEQNKDNNEPSYGNYTINVGIEPSSNNTKVELDGYEIKWKKGDVILVAEIGEENKFLNLDIYSINGANNISADGKSATFYGPTLKEGKKYVAIHARGNLGEYFGGMDAYKGYFVRGSFMNNGYGIISYSGDNNLIDKNLLLLSQIVLVENNTEPPQFVFRHMESVLELNIKLEPNITKDYNLDKIKIELSSGGISPENICFDATGNIIYNTTPDKFIEVSFNNESKINALEPYIVRVPIAWNPKLNDLVSDNEFIFTITTKNGNESKVIRPAKILIPGTLYRANLEFNEPQNMVESDRAALMAIYNKMGGEYWIESTELGPLKNWGSDLPLSEWDDIEVNEQGRVKFIYIRSTAQELYEIPAEFGKLTCLEWIGIDASVKGAIPKEFENLVNLKDLHIIGYFNEGKSTLKDVSILQKLSWLERLSVMNQQVSGNLDWLENLVNLYDLDLGNNNITGNFPEFLVSRLDNIDRLCVNGNYLSGNLPKSLIEHPQWAYMSKAIMCQKGEGFNKAELSYPFPHFESPDIVTNVNVSTKEIISKNKLTLVMRVSANRVPVNVFKRINSIYKEHHDAGFEVILSFNVFGEDVPVIKDYLIESNYKWHNPVGWVPGFYVECTKEVLDNIILVNQKGEIIYDGYLLPHLYKPTELEEFIKQYLLNNM